MLTACAHRFFILVLSLVWQCEKLFEAFLKHGWLTLQQILDRVPSNQNEGEPFGVCFACILLTMFATTIFHWNFNISNMLEHFLIEVIFVLVVL